MYEIYSKLLKEKGLSSYKISKECGISQSSLSDWKKGRSKPKHDKMLRIAEYLGVSVVYLETGVEPTISEVEIKKEPGTSPIQSIYDSLNKDGQKEILRYGRYLTAQDEFRREDAEPQIEYIRHYLTAAAAGYAAPIEGEDFELVPKDENVPARADFCVDITGDSMEPYIHDGQRVYVQREANLSDMDVGIFFVDGDVYCKQYCIDYVGTLRLLSANPKREDANIYFKKGSGRNVVCFGKVILPRKLPAPIYD